MWQRALLTDGVMLGTKCRIAAAVQLLILLAHTPVLSVLTQLIVTATHTSVDVPSTAEYPLHLRIPVGRLCSSEAPEGKTLCHNQPHISICFLTKAEYAALCKSHSARIYPHRKCIQSPPLLNAHDVPMNPSIEEVRKRDMSTCIRKRPPPHERRRELEHSETVVSLSPLVRVAKAWNSTAGKALQHSLLWWSLLSFL